LSYLKFALAKANASSKGVFLASCAAFPPLEAAPLQNRFLSINNNANKGQIFAAQYLSKLMNKAKGSDGAAAGLCSYE